MFQLRLDDYLTHQGEKLPNTALELAGCAVRSAQR